MLVDALCGALLASVCATLWWCATEVLLVLQQSKCLWSVELPEAVTALEVMDHTSRGFKAGGWAQQLGGRASVRMDSACYASCCNADV